jgi:hypothetical protein
LKNYPTVFEEGPLPDKVIGEANTLVQVLEKTAIEKKIDSFHIDLFLIPFPDLQAFRDELLKELGLK